MVGNQCLLNECVIECICSWAGTVRTSCPAVERVLAQLVWLSVLVSFALVANFSVFR